MTERRKPLELANDCPINPGDPGTDALGFTKDRFAGGSYLWRMGDELWFSMIISKHPGKGAFRELLNSAEAIGFKVIVPTAMGLMPAILHHYGLRPALNKDGVEVWSRP